MTYKFIALAMAMLIPQVALTVEYETLPEGDTVAIHCDAKRLKTYSSRNKPEQLKVSCKGKTNDSEQVSSKVNLYMKINEQVRFTCSAEEYKITKIDDLDNALFISCGVPKVSNVSSAASEINTASIPNGKTAIVFCNAKRLKTYTQNRKPQLLKVFCKGKTNRVDQINSNADITLDLGGRINLICDSGDFDVSKIGGFNNASVIGCGADAGDIDEVEEDAMNEEEPADSTDTPADDVVTSTPSASGSHCPANPTRVVEYKFDSADVGQSPYNVIKSKFAANVMSSMRKANHAIINTAEGPVLRIQYQKGKVGGGSGAGFYAYKGFDKKDLHACFEYDVQFDKRFEFVRGGKLPGFFGGSQSVSGCKSSSEVEKLGFSTRLMWYREGAGTLYGYWPYKKAPCGDYIGRGNFFFKPGQWHTITQDLKLNTVGEKDGYVKLYNNGELVVEDNNRVLRTNNEFDIKGFMFSTFHGGGDPSWAPPNDQYTFFRNIKFYFYD